MIILFTDFGLSGPYTGQMKAAIYKKAPTVPIIDLFSDAPTFNPQASAYLLAAYYQSMPCHAVFLSVVDPGVGSDRRALVVRVGNRYFVGPDNGIFEMVMRTTNEQVTCWDVTWQPKFLSSTFHGRDLFAPIAADICLDPDVLEDKSLFIPIETPNIRYPDWPDDLPEIVYIDRYGNALTGIRSHQSNTISALEINGKAINEAQTFSSVDRGDLFYYANSNGLLEIAVNQGRAADHLSLKIGHQIKIISSD